LVESAIVIMILQSTSISILFSQITRKNNSGWALLNIYINITELEGGS
jgi:hypothetical protein